MSITQVQLEYPGSYAPGCYLLRRIEDDHETRDTILVQTDWDFPGVAQAFGWTPCHCGGTDGTVDCRDCGRTAGEMITEADQYLFEHDGERVEDPGYFA